MNAKFVREKGEGSWMDVEGALLLVAVSSSAARRLNTPGCSALRMHLILLTHAGETGATLYFPLACKPQELSDVLRSLGGLTLARLPPLTLPDPSFLAHTRARRLLQAILLSQLARTARRGLAAAANCSYSERACLPSGLH